jgi:AGZA family xanthine/uracil permease-like MFS transporter
VIAAFLLVDIFDTAGTLLGVGRVGGLLDQDGRLPRAERAFLADALATIAGALVGTSTVTSYVESAAGIEEGGRTGLVAVQTGILFLASLFFVPVLVAIPAAATAPALIVVGAMMMRPVALIEWKSPLESLPAFLTLIVMPFTSSIANGIAAGVITWVVLRVVGGRWREVKPALWIVALVLGFFLVELRA